MNNRDWEKILKIPAVAKEKIHFAYLIAVF